MVWDLIQQSRKEEADLAVVWLDLANAYGSVPHVAIMFALSFFWIPEHVSSIIKLYLDVYEISFLTRDYKSESIPLEKGVAAGDTISPLLFIMVKAAKVVGEAVTCPKVNEALPPIRAFMDDLTCMQQSYEAMVRLLGRLEELIHWVRMRFKPAKCRSLVMIKGSLVDRSFELRGLDDVMSIPTVLEKPVKCLGRLYTAALSDSGRKVDVRKMVEDGMGWIGDCKLQGTLKCWMYQYGLLPRIMWPLMMYEFPVTYVEELERFISKHLRRWLCVPPGLTNLALYSTSTKLKLPIKSVLEEFMVGKCRTVVALESSKDPVIQSVQPDVVTGLKWKASCEVHDAKSDIYFDNIVGAAQTSRHGLGWNTDSKQPSFSTQITDKVRSRLEKERYVKACQQPSQGRWTNWETLEVRELSWKEMWDVSDKRMSMMIKSAYDVLGTPANLKTWKLQDSDECTLCGMSPCNLKHILSACSVGLASGRYTWRHDRVLKCIVSACETVISEHNSNPPIWRTNSIQFRRSGETQARTKTTRASVLGSGNDWTVLSDLHTQLVVPEEVAQTALRPDIVMWSRKTKNVILCELTCPWEENAEWAHERKLAKYESLKNEIQDNGFVVRVFAVEVGCRGFVSRSLRGFLMGLGCSNRKIKKVIKECCEAAERSSVKIYMSKNDRWSHEDV